MWRGPIAALLCLVCFWACTVPPHATPADAGGRCGDGILDRGEECDDGAGNSDLVPGGCRTDCRVQYCGNEQVDPGELCDDGNLDGEDACPADCGVGLTRCGDGVLDPEEECDDGNLDNWDGCTLICQVAEMRVHSHVPGTQQSFPGVWMAPGGSFIVSWRDDVGDTRIGIRRFSREGTAIESARFTYDADCPGGCSFGGLIRPFVSADTSYSITWTGWNELRRIDYAADGSRLDSSEALVVAPEFGLLTWSADGSSAATWRDASSALYTQVFDANSSPRTAPLLVDPEPNFDFAHAPLSSTGEFVVVWRTRPNLTEYLLMRQRYHADGTRDGSPVVIDTIDVPSPAHKLGLQDVALSDAETLAVSWTTDATELGKFNCYYGVYGAGGAPLLPAGRCAPGVINSSNGAQLTRTGGNQFAMVYAVAVDPTATSINTDPIPHILYVRWLGADGAPLTQPVRVSRYPVRAGGYEISGIEDGRVVVVFTNGFGDNSIVDPPGVDGSTDVFVRLLYPPTPPSP